MASPSSVTTPSPPLAHPPNKSTTTTVASTRASSSLDASEKQERDKAVRRFLARAEVSKLTFDLRARLSYASYKASHKVPHLPLHDLEVKTQVASLSRSVPIKRKVGSTSNHYISAATQNNSPMSMNMSSGHVSRQGQMAPPPPVSRSSSSGLNAADNGGSANAGQSLFTTILGPPAAKQARTIRNPSSAFVPVASRPSNSQTRSRKDSRHIDHLRSPRAPRTQVQAAEKRQQHKDRRQQRVKGTNGHNRKGKEKERITPDSVASGDTNGDDSDMKAAATLTSLLRARPSISSSTLSPRSSISAISEADSAHSYSQFAQSSTRTTTAVSSAQSSFINRPSTPPSRPTPAINGTPKRPAPTDTEAADLMLYLATSPSPVRPGINRAKDARDMGAFRALSGGSELRAKGRVLFPAIGTHEASSQADDRSRGGGGGGGASVTEANRSSASVGMGQLSITNGRDNGSGAGKDGLTKAALTPAQLLPAPPSPSSTASVVSNPFPDSSFSSSSSYSLAASDHKQPLQGPPTPSNVPFNMNEYLNVSPSPATPQKGLHPKGGMAGRRGDVSRKLFEEEEHLVRVNGESEQIDGASRRTSMFADDIGGLGAGIDLVKS